MIRLWKIVFKNVVAGVSKVILRRQMKMSMLMPKEQSRKDKGNLADCCDAMLLAMTHVMKDFSRLCTILTMFFILCSIFVKPAEAKNRYRASDVMMVATVLWHEAGGQGEKEMHKVANVIINRYSKFAGHSKDGYELEIGDILTKSAAFSFSSAYLTSRMTDSDLERFIVNSRTGQSQLGGAAWQTAKKLAQQALSGQLQDLTHGATHFQVCNLSKNGGYWGSMWRAGKNAYAIREISTSGGHCYYRNISDGSMKVNGHVFLDKGWDAAYSTGQKKITVYQGGGTGEGMGKGSDTYQGTYGEYYRKLGLRPGEALNGAPIGSGGGNYGQYDPGSGTGYSNNTGTYSGAIGGNYSSGAKGVNPSISGLVLSDEEYVEYCKSAKTETDGSTTPPNLFNTQILVRMKHMMEKIYQSLGQLYALGQSLMCYATHTAPLNNVLFHMVNIPYWLGGFAIYITAFFITVSIGLYFVDVVFKIGFALMMLPISIALWPFEPTRGKLSENFSIIIRNSMLFALVGIGISFAIILIQNGVLQGINEIKFNHALQNANTAEIAKMFELSGIHILIILFCLIYGYKIIGASVENYLDRIFPDNLFGGDSTMHENGVQFFGNMATHTVLPVASIGVDIVRNQASRGLTALGNGLQGAGQYLSKPRQFNPETPTADEGSEPSDESTGTSRRSYGNDEGEADNDFELPINPDDGGDDDNGEIPMDDAEKKRQKGKKNYEQKLNKDKKQKPKTLADKKKENQQVHRQTGSQNPTAEQANPVKPTTEAPQQAASQQPNSSNLQGQQTPQSNGSIWDSIKQGAKEGAQTYDQGISLSPGNILKGAFRLTGAVVAAPLNKKTYTQLWNLPEILSQQKENYEKQQRDEEKAFLAAHPDATPEQLEILRKQRKKERRRIILQNGSRLVVRSGIRTVADTAGETLKVSGSFLTSLGAKIKPSKPNGNFWADYLDEQEYRKIKEEKEENERKKREAGYAEDFVDRGK